VSIKEVKDTRVKVGIFVDSGQRKLAEQMLRLLKEDRIHASAYQMGRSWERLNGEEIKYNFSSLTHIVVIFSASASSSRWLGFVSGYGVGRECPVFLYSADESALPGHLLSFTRVNELEELRDELLLARQVWRKSARLEHARAELQAMGLGISEEVLAACVEEGNIPAVANFLRIGFSPDSRDERGVPVLSLAIRNRHRELIDLFLKHQANVNAVSLDRGNSPLMEAAVRGDKESVQQLISADADPDLQSKNGQTALMLAVGEGFTEVARLLLERGAHTSPVDQLGMTAGKYAQLFKHTEMAELIRRSEEGKVG